MILDGKQQASRQAQTDIPELNEGEQASRHARGSGPILTVLVELIIRLNC